MNASTTAPLTLNPDRLFPTDPATRTLARALYASIHALPIISPHGHTDPAWFADDTSFSDPASLFIIPDHYVFRMLYSQGVALESLGVPTRDGTAVETNKRAIWRRFAEHWPLFRGTPSRMWLDHAFHDIFGVRERLSSASADRIYDQINAQLATAAFKPRALLERFNIEVIATTESPLDPLAHHAKLNADGLGQRVITAYRPDAITDPDFEGFANNVAQMSALTGENCSTWAGMRRAHLKRRAFFKAHGATSTDHGHPSAFTCVLSDAQSQALWDKALKGEASAQEAEQIRGAWLIEMARMSLTDGLTMQLHPGAFRSHNPQVFARFGRDKGADVPVATEYVRALKPLLDEVGNDARLTLILFTLDETVYSRELAPLAGHYPCLKLGPPWWFHDSPEGMLRFRKQAIETAGFYNTVGFNDDTRAFMSIPARHDVARRIDCRALAELVLEHRLDEDEAFELAHELTVGLVRRAYQLNR